MRFTVVLKMIHPIFWSLELVSVIVSLVRFYKKEITSNTSGSFVVQVHLRHTVAQLKPGVFLLPCVTRCCHQRGHQSERTDEVQAENPDQACNAAGEITAPFYLAHHSLPFTQMWPDMKKPFTSFDFLIFILWLYDWQLEVFIDFLLVYWFPRSFLNQLDRTLGFFRWGNRGKKGYVMRQ